MDTDTWDRKESARPGRTALGLNPVLAACLVLGILGLNVLYSTQAVAMDLDFYRSGWEALDVPSQTGMPIGELSRAGTALIDYFSGSVDSPQIEAVIYGAPRPLYNQRELGHLVDVRNLFAVGFAAQKACWLLALLPFLSLLGLCLPSRLTGSRTGSRAGSRPNPADCIRTSLGALARPLIIAGAVGMGLLILLAIPASMDFTDWWTKFHLLSFTNDLWLLNPNTDWLIRMFPEEFFFRAVTAIGLRSLALSALVLALGLVARHLSVKHDH